MSLDFLLEIGTEEIPHWMIPGALEQIAKFDVLGAKVQVDATPRRLVLRASGVPERTPDSEHVVKGPPLTSGDKAAEGFAKKQGADVSALRKAGNYYELVKKVPGRLATEILAESLPGAILGLQWPKTMYWTGGKTGPRFIRPIRWIVALLGDQVVPFEIAGVKSGLITRGHRQLGSASIPVNVANYEGELRKNGVILSADERRKRIEAESGALNAKIEPKLLETLTYITEFPSAIRGDFNPSYLELPAEVLTTVMAHHQKYFSVETAPGKLAAHFVAILNTSGDPEGLVKHGNERVLKARFNDARFFWDVDQQKKLADRVNDLEKVTFQAKLGSYKAKTDRVVALVKELGGDANAQRAALLCKCDLTTEMVKEFTDLQGVVGGLYARAQGENESVSRAIYEHYKPLSMEDSIPSTRDGQIVALADKLDTLRECFKIGMMPTGSKDPFALRRAAQGVVKILAETLSDQPLETLVDNNPDLRAFMLERIQYYFREIRGFRYDEINAVIAGGVTSVAVFEGRLSALSELHKTPKLEQIANAFKRIRNILKKAEFNRSGEPSNSHLQEPSEHELFEAIQKARQSVAFWRPKGMHQAELDLISDLWQPLDRFFTDVMVMADDPQVRQNRLAMLNHLYVEFSQFADFSEIVTQESAIGAL